MTVATMNMMPESCQVPSLCLTPPRSIDGGDEHAVEMKTHCPPTPRSRKSLLSMDVKTSLLDNLEMLSAPDLMSANSRRRRTVPSFDYSFEKSQEMFYRSLDRMRQGDALQRLRDQAQRATSIIIDDAVAVATDGSATPPATSFDEGDEAVEAETEEVSIRFSDLITPVPQDGASRRTVSQQMLIELDESPTGVMDFFTPPLLAGDAGKGKDGRGDSDRQQEPERPGLQRLDSL